MESVRTPDDEQKFLKVTGAPPATREELQRHRPDASLVAVLDDGRPVARVSLWWNGTPELPKERIGVLGHFASIDRGATRQLLAEARRILAEHRCNMAVGPMDGNTWRRYRFVIDGDRETPFFLEPTNPPEWPRDWRADGFAPLAHYTSAMTELAGDASPPTSFLASRFPEGYNVRSLDIQNPDVDLHALYRLSLASFRGNYLYTPIEEREFLAQYDALLPHLRPELILLAEQGNELAGFLFALPDLLQARRDAPLDTVIFKTLAVHPNHAGRGLGGALTAQAAGRARELGYRCAIHALMHESNRSQRISRHTARTIRRYALLARTTEESG